MRSAEAGGRRRGRLFVGALAGTFVVLRVALGIAPEADFDVGAYNVHHLYTGIVLLTLAGIPLIIARPEGRWGDVALVGFAVGLGMALDEWVYLIVTDGSNASYLLPVSFCGGAAAVAIACAYAHLASVRDGKGPRAAPEKSGDESAHP